MSVKRIEDMIRTKQLGDVSRTEFFPFCKKTAIRKLAVMGAS